MNWISVKERLPEDGIPVLIHSARGYAIAYRTEHSHPILGEWIGYYGLWGFCEVTHWMPLPELPMEEA